jgi:hypothetical protein
MTQKAIALSNANRPLAQLEYRFHFAPWWIANEYRVAPSLVPITDTDHDYFNKIESLTDTRLELEQRAWYVATRDNAFGGDWALMKQEFPSTPEEAFEQSQDGVYYGQQMAAARRTERVTNIAYDPRVPVNTFWDLGKDDDTCIWFHQHINGWDNWIDFYECSDQAFSHYAGILQEKGYTYGRHYLPHDGEHRAWGADQLKTPRDMLYDLGLRNIVNVPRTPNLTTAIRQVRDAFPKYRFDQIRCKVGLHHLDHYRKSWNERVGAWSDIPLKNGHQHAADAIRQHAQVFTEAPAPGTFKRRRKPSGMAA